MARSELKETEIFYPESDGVPMDSDLHRDLMFELIDSVDRRYRDDPQFYVSGTLFIYYEEGNPKKCVGPDFFVVRGVPRGMRRVYKLWEEKKGPNLVIELTSPSSYLEDLGNKRALYEKLSVQEYFIFDPEGARFQPPLRGFKLIDGILQPSQPLRVQGQAIVFFSEVLNLELHACGPSLRWVDRQTGRSLPTYKDLGWISEMEKGRADMEKKRADAAEAELARLKRELDQLKGDDRQRG